MALARAISIQKNPIKTVFFQKAFLGKPDSSLWLEWSF